MDAISMIKERRSVRKYKDEKVDRELMKEIVEISQYAPSWSNTQVVRYTLVDDESIIKKIGEEAVKGFNYNTSTLTDAKGVAILSCVPGKSGKMDKYGIASNNAEVWETFDAGIACQTFCLAAHAKGVGTVIMGVIDQEKIAELIELPEGETVAGLIVYGYPAETPSIPRRKPTEDILRFLP